MTHHLTLGVRSRCPVEFIDITERVEGLVAEAGLINGVAVVFTRHTTTGLLINEHEPLLLGDLRALFERLAPATRAYAHDDFGRRTVNLGPNERRNGHAHCRAAFLRTSESLPVLDGSLALGRWQRLFLVDFDGGQHREVGVTLFWSGGEIARMPP